MSSDLFQGLGYVLQAAERTIRFLPGRVILRVGGVFFRVLDRLIELFPADFRNRNSLLGQNSQAAGRDIGEGYKAHIGRHFPSMTMVQVVALLEPEALVEIDCIAVVPD